MFSSRRNCNKTVFEIFIFLSSAKHTGEEGSGPPCLGGGLKKSGKQEREVITCEMYFPSFLWYKKAQVGPAEWLIG